MVDSGVDWIGQIPTDWNIKKVKQIAFVSKGNQYDFDPSENKGVIPYINGGVKPSWYSNKSNREKNLIAISEGGASAGYVQQINTPWWCGAHCYSVKPYLKNDGNFIFWLLKASEVFLQEEKTGTAMPNLQSGKLLNLALSIPTVTEQHSIANFLDHHVNLIDREASLIDKKIELLGEKRKALIFECVTGKRTVVEKSTVLNRADAVGHGGLVSVPTEADQLVDSGVDWIGKIPKDWDVKRFKNSLSLSSGKYIDKTNSEGEYYIYGANGPIGTTNLQNIFIPTLLIGRVGSAGALNFAHEGFASDNVLLAQNKSQFCLKHIYFTLSVFNFKDIISITSHPLLTASSLLNTYTTFPSINNQLKISSFLDFETSLIDKEISLLKQKQNLLMEKRKALIFEAVTGKIDCRNWTL